MTTQFSTRFLAAMMSMSLAFLHPLQAADTEANALVQRFLAHMAANKPIAGTFEIRTSHNPRVRAIEDELDKTYSKGKVTLHAPAPERLLVCRWAIADGREINETLPDSREHFANFYQDREGLLEGVAPKSFRLRSAQNSPEWRPACFYSHVGMSTWDSRLADCDCSLAKRSDTDPVDESTIVARSKSYNFEYRIAVNNNTSVLRKVQVYYNGMLVRNLTIESMKKSGDHRVFPDRATMITYDEKILPDEPHRTISLVARSIEFPTTTAETNARFQLTVPAGAVIADLTLNRAIDVSAATTAADIVRGHIPAKNITPIPKYDPELFGIEEASGPTYFNPWVVGCIVTVLAVGCLLLFKLRNKTNPN